MKEEIVDVVQKSRANIRALESSIETIKRQDNNMQKNCMELNREIDNLIDQLIEHLERKRQSIKDDLRESATVQKENLDAQKESFQMSLGCLKSSVEFTEDALNRGSEVKILSAKNQMIQQLTELNSATSDLKPRGHIYYSLETDFKPRGRIYNPQENLDAQIESLQASSGSLRSSVGLTEEAATRRSEAEILSPKNQMIQQQSEHNSATSDFKPIAGRRIYNRLETCYPPINFAALGKIAEIREYDEEYPRLYPRLNWSSLSRMLAMTPNVAIQITWHFIQSDYTELELMTDFPFYEKCEYHICCPTRWKDYKNTVRHIISAF